MLKPVIGSPLSIGLVSEVVPVAPRADVRAPLVMERLLPLIRSDELVEQITALAEVARGLPASWQRLVSAEFSTMEAHLIYERFVGVTLRDLSASLRTSGRVLPLDVLRAVIEHTCEGLAPLTGPRTVPLSDRSVGLGIDGEWRFAQGALNHWLINLASPRDPTDMDQPMPSDTVLLMSPEGIQGRPETAASPVTRAALLAWQLATGGFHPYRGGRHELMASLTRFSRDDPRVPLDVHPGLTPALIEVLTRGVAFTSHRFADLPSFRAALDAVWPEPAAGPARTLEVIASLTWSTLQKELHLLKREPLLPIRWDGVWSAARTPEEGIAVLEDQLLERLEPLDRYPSRGAVEVPIDPPPERPHAPQVYVPRAPQPTPPHRPGLFQRFLALFRR